LKKSAPDVPLLRDSEPVALGLKIPDSIPASRETPTALVSIETSLIGQRQLGVNINYLTGSLADAANKGYRIAYCVIAQGGTPPASPGELNKLFYTRRNKDVIEFGVDDSGKTVYFAVQIENEGKTGPWGPLVQALIP
jgi:hypothetical protein